MPMNHSMAVFRFWQMSFRSRVKRFDIDVVQCPGWIGCDPTYIADLYRLWAANGGCLIRTRLSICSRWLMAVLSIFVIQAVRTEARLCITRANPIMGLSRKALFAGERSDSQADASVGHSALIGEGNSIKCAEDSGLVRRILQIRRSFFFV